MGYIRMKAIEVTRYKPHPQWYDVKSPSNDISAANLGQIMCNVQFMRNTANLPKRKLLDKGRKMYHFFY